MEIIFSKIRNPFETSKKVKKGTAELKLIAFNTRVNLSQCKKSWNISNGQNRISNLLEPDMNTRIETKFMLQQLNSKEFFFMNGANVETLTHNL